MSFWVVGVVDSVAGDFFGSPVLCGPLSLPLTLSSDSSGVDSPQGQNDSLCPLYRPKGFDHGDLNQCGLSGDPEKDCVAYQNLPKCIGIKQ